MMISVRSLREADFRLYIDTLSQMAPWFFSLHHSNYARCDMVTPANKNPAVHEEFLNGNFAVRKPGRAFSNITIN